MIRNIAAFGATVLMIFSQAAHISAGPLYQPPIMSPSDEVVQSVTSWRGFRSMGGVYYYNGYRGIVVARPSYRFYRGYWFPPGAFATGVIIGLSLATPIERPAGLTAAHIRWCLQRYRTYRVYDNTYQPYSGPRRECWSPYS